ncbi:hypothetical protein MLD38_010282 [Melastoma candidum]|uniref:Uncharacterized protein n=1 Tax=Melastoma candidum TaxID=119954 RepID=A0ACB9QZC1_9MYRT|nr:hypothetical protein MLD38_010282 [Melastoma candidum]
MAKVLGGLPFLVVLSILSALGGARELHEMSMMERHEQWMSLYGRMYKDEPEKARRFEIFKSNVEFIESFNKDGDKSYRLGINKFSDMTNEELRAARNGYKKSPSRSSRITPFQYENVTAVPYSMDWRKKGAVTPIKDQKHCGSCWAFSVVAATEGINQLTTGKLISFFIIKNHGLTTETNSPYKGVDSICKRNKEASHAARITGYEAVPANKEAALLKAAAHQPISVAIDASSSEFMSYSGGIFAGPCGTDLDHGVTVVGYGTTADGTKYWLVKNSWGKSWGESGYIRMKRDVNAAEGLCGIAMQASYPTA